jgi:hypothetical protein
LEIQDEQVQEEYGGPQAPRCVDANIICEQGKLLSIPQIILGFSFKSLLYNKVLLCIKFIGID